MDAASPKIFISYSHDDEEWKDRLVRHLRVSQKQGHLTLWTDRETGAGEDWEERIKEAMNAAGLAILLISAHSLTSDFILKVEMRRLLQRREREGLRIFPIVIKPCDWEAVDWLRRMQFRPKDGHPISGGNEHQIDADLAAIAKEIRLLLSRNVQLSDSHDWQPIPSNTSSGQKYNLFSRRDAVTKEEEEEEIEITINRPIDEFSGDAQKRLLRAFDEFLEIGPIRIIKKRPGSTKITLALPSDKAEELLSAIKAGDFKEEYDVISASYKGRLVPHLVMNVPQPEALPDESAPTDIREATESLRQRASEAHDHGDYDEAIRVWSSLISLAPKNPVPYYNRGNTYFAMERYENALADYDTSIELYPELSYPYNNRGIVHGELGHSEEALSDFNKAIELDPTLAEAHHNRGITFQRAGDYATALADYDSAIEFKPDYIDAYLNRGRINGWIKHYKEALRDFNKAIELEPNSAKLYWNRGTTYIYLERYEEAIDDFNKALELKPGYAEAYCNRGVAHERRNHVDQALADYTAAIEFKPDYVDAYRNRGIFRTGLGRFEEALADFEKAIELKPGYADTYNSRGVAYAKLERLEEALDNFSRAIGLDPSFAEAHNNRGGIHAILNDLPEAIAAFDAAIEHDPDFVGAYDNRGSAHWDLRKYEAALQDFSTVIDLDPNSHEGFSSRANTLLKLRRYNEAKQDLEKAIELDPYHTRDYLALAETFIFIRSFDRALSVAERAESLSDEPRDRILSRYYKCLALRLGRKETHEADTQLVEALQEPVHLNWSFEEIRTWMASADLDAQTREYILQITERLESLGGEGPGSHAVVAYR